MHIGAHDAAAIYARACRAWYGDRAGAIVSKRVRELRAKGDDSGVKAWTLVATELERVEPQDKSSGEA
jgi:hypothetical protein